MILESIGAACENDSKFGKSFETGAKLSETIGKAAAVVSIRSSKTASTL